MWPMIAEPDLRCAECRHTIQPGRLCLSELPEETPASVSRSDFNNYCIGCPECWAQGKTRLLSPLLGLQRENCQYASQPAMRAMWTAYRSRRTSCRRNLL